MQEWSRLHLALTVGDLCMCVCVRSGANEERRCLTIAATSSRALGDGGWMEWQVVNVKGRVISVDTRGAVAVKGLRLFVGAQAL